MKQTILQKRIPTLFGLILLVVSILLTSFFVRKNTIFQSRATPDTTPQNVRITNITDTSFTVTYQTREKVTGVITYGQEQPTDKTVFDERDERKSISQPYILHSFTLQGLKPASKYAFSIISGSQTYYDTTRPSSQIPFYVTTAPFLEKKPKPFTLNGRVLMPDGSVPAEAIVYVTFENSQMLSTRTNSHGEYTISQSKVRSADLLSHAKLSNDSIFHVLVLGDLLQSTASFTAKQISSLPPLTLSQNYDFTTQFSGLSALEEFIASTSGIGLPLFSSLSTKKLTQEVTILTPQKNEKFTDPQPVFRGTAAPHTTVTIVIRSEAILKSQAKTDAKGLWKFRPQTQLTPGQHTITISAMSSSGIKRTITNSFIIFASGSQVSASATPSATPIITLRPTPSLIPTLIPTIVLPTTLPSPTLMPTVVPTARPTFIPTPTPIPPSIAFATPTQVPPPLSPGSSSLTTFGIGAIITVTLGILLFFVTSTHPL